MVIEQCAIVMKNAYGIWVVAMLPIAHTRFIIRSINDYRNNMNKSGRLTR